jgi:hypothetical protein
MEGQEPDTLGVVKRGRESIYRVRGQLAGKNLAVLSTQWLLAETAFSSLILFICVFVVYLTTLSVAQTT